MAVEHAPNVNEIIKIVMPGIFVCTAFSALAAHEIATAASLPQLYPQDNSVEIDLSSSDPGRGRGLDVASAD
jgi:hypothetical protein